MRVEPRQLVRHGPPQRGPQEHLVGVQYRKLSQHFLGFSERIVCREKWCRASKRPGRRRNKFHDRLVRNSNGIFRDPSPQDLSCDLLAVQEPWVETIDEDVRINERGHDDKGPLGSTPGSVPMPRGSDYSFSAVWPSPNRSGEGARQGSLS